MASITGLQDEADEHCNNGDSIGSFMPLTYNNGDSIGSSNDTTSEFERGGGMRLNVDDLLEQRKAKIEELRARLGPALPQSQEFDDIFLLRFVLTWEKKGGMVEAEKAIRSTIAWRMQNAAVLAETRRTGVAPHEAKFKKFHTSGYSGDLAGLEPLYIVRSGLCNFKGLMNSMTNEEVAVYLLMSKEVAFAKCDALTRKTRQLIKMITVLDMAGYSMFGGDSRFYKALGLWSLYKEPIFRLAKFSKFLTTNLSFEVFTKNLSFAMQRFYKESII
jgi:hypothetical protein